MEKVEADIFFHGGFKEGDDDDDYNDNDGDDNDNDDDNDNEDGGGLCDNTRRSGVKKAGSECDDKTLIENIK